MPINAMRFGTIHLMLPVDADKPVPTRPPQEPVPRDDWAMIHANTVAELLAKATDQGYFNPMTDPSQVIRVPTMSPETHPFVSRRGDQTFQEADVLEAVKTHYDSSSNALRVRIDEAKLPLATLRQLMIFFLQVTLSVTGKSMHYGVVDTPLKPAYEQWIDHLDAQVFQQNKRALRGYLPPDSLN